MKFILKTIIVLILFTFEINSQTRVDNWAFGENSGINISAIDQSVTVLNDLNIFSLAAASSISNTDGILKLYTNGSVATSQQNNFIITDKGLGGEHEKIQSTIIIPKPNQPNIYYIFSTREKPSPNIFDPISPGFYYSEVDVLKNEIITKRTQLLSTPTSKISAVHHKDGKSIWLVALGMHTFENESEPSRAFFTFKISEIGIENDIKIKKLREDTLPKDGAMKISPDGTKIAYTSLEEGISLHNFNLSDGSISNTLNIPKINPIKTYYVYGLEFSVNSKYLYTSSKDEESISYIHQYNLTRDNVFLKYNELYKSFPNTNSNYGALQIATNGKIYHSINLGSGLNNNSNYLGVIDNIEEEIPEANYTHNKINLGSGKSYLGLPSFIQSYFNTKITTVQGCVNIPTIFKAEAYTTIDDAIWDFGDGNFGNGASPKHTYFSPGIYQVSAIVNYDNQSLKVFQEIEIFPLPEVKNNQKLIQCDSNGTGKAFYNLNEISSKIVDEFNNKGFVFYEKEIDAINGFNHIPNPSKYENKTLNQKIYVRVVDLKGCYSITSFLLETTFIDLEEIETLYACDNLQNEAKGLFLLDQKESTIRRALNIPNTSKLRFFSSFLDAQILSDELPDEFISNSKKIWVRIDTELGCGGISSFDIVVNSELKINLKNTYTICFNPLLKPDITINADGSNDSFEWKNDKSEILSTESDFLLNTIGKFSLTVYKSENGLLCSNTHYFTVINPDKPSFTSINVNTEDENNNIVEIFLNGNSSYEFSLDNENFLGNSNSYTFTNVESGLRTVYIRDINNCEEPIQTNVSVIGFKKFFTPNGDGANDYWNIKGLDNISFKSINLSIFNRYGKIIGNINKLDSEGWNGKYNGKPLSSNSYWFIAVIIDKDDKVIKKSGTFSLITN